jgi:hypothetical protein
MMAANSIGLTLRNAPDLRNTALLQSRASGIPAIAPHDGETVVKTGLAKF